MKKQRYQFSVTFLMFAVLSVACISAFLVSFGPHLVWASTHMISPNYPAMSRIKPEVHQANERMIACQFENLIFSIPESMARNARIVRPSANDIWVSFEDTERQLQIPLIAKPVRAQLGRPPLSIAKETVPKLLETIASASTDDFSFWFTRDQLAVHQWALENRKVFDNASTSMHRFSIHSSKHIDTITISVDPDKVDAKKTVRSLLVWESFDQNQSGTLWFGDASKKHADWIDAVTRSVDLEPSQPHEYGSHRKYTSMTDAELLSLARLQLY